MRIGLGIDVHRFAAGRRMRLGGVDIPGDVGLAGHSDADAVLHAAMDAMLGALALGDIGQLFPDSDPAYRDIDSRVLARQVWENVGVHGYRMGNLDITVLAEIPRIAPHAVAMQQAMAALFDCETDQISVKATTTEQMGFPGRREGLVAHAVVLLVPSVSDRGGFVARAPQ